MSTNTELQLDNIFNKTTSSKLIHECVLLVENSTGDLSYQNGYGGRDVDSPLLMASITKLFTTACILILLEQGKLTLEDKVTKYFDSQLLSRLHVYKDQEYTSTLTLHDLLFQTSGLPDVFEESSNSLKKRVIGEDYGVQFDEIIELTKQLKPHFAPNKKNRAHYADVNFDMFGEIIENLTGLTLADAYKQLIFNPLELHHTYLPVHEQEFIPNIYYKDTAIHRPQYIRSCRASGGGISTARELMIFLKGFFGGRLFDPAVFRKLEVYNKLQASMYPIQYGGGYMRIPMKGLTTMFMGKGELVGHSGSSGSFAFYYPHKDLFIVGDVNQVATPVLPIRLVMRLAMSLKI